MNSNKRGSLVVGLLLVLMGIWFLVVQFVPGLAEQFKLEQSWPLIVVGVGVFLLVLVRARDGRPGLHCGDWRAAILAECHQ
jgi:hypothetical protein